jgi:hypothetical protein
VLLLDNRAGQPLTEIVCKGSVDVAETYGDELLALGTRSELQQFSGQDWLTLKALHAEKINDIAVTTVGDEITALMTKLNAADAIARARLDDEEALEVNETLTDEEFEQLDAKLSNVGMNHIRAKVALMHRLTRWSRSCANLKTLEIQKNGVTNAVIQAINTFNKRGQAFLFVAEAHKAKLSEIGLGHKLSPAVFEASDVIKKQAAANKVMRDMVEGEAKRFFDAKIEMLKAVCPSAVTVSNPQVMLVDKLAAEILENPKRAEITPQVVELQKIQELLIEASLFAPMRKAIEHAIDDGKRALGSHFALKKLAKLKTMSASSDRDTLVDDSLNTIDSKGICLVAFMRKALLAFRSAPAPSPPVAAKGKGKGKIGGVKRN